jgi:hypothetical protein
VDRHHQRIQPLLVSRALVVLEAARTTRGFAEIAPKLRLSARLSDPDRLTRGVAWFLEGIHCEVGRFWRQHNLTFEVSIDPGGCMSHSLILCVSNAGSVMLAGLSGIRRRFGPDPQCFSGIPALAPV